MTEIRIDTRIEAYIAQAAPFAQLILRHLRAVMHRALPGIEETVTWSMPHFMLGGKNVAGMAAFKAHCAFTIHGGGRQGPTGDDAETGMGHYGRITDIADLPDESVMTQRLHAARDRVQTSGSATKRPAARAHKDELPVPDELVAALAGNAAAQAHFAAFTPSHRREYNDWIGEAKQSATRERRVAQAIAWIAEGKKRNWKYENC